jgi:MFS family permease
MQRTAQDWLVLTVLTRHSGVATGITVGLQFVPLLLFSPYVGVLADRRSKQRILVWSQSLLGLGALVLSLLVMTHTAHLWEVYCCALGTGFGSALDNPARQALVPEIVPRAAVPSAVGLLSATQNIARMVGPAGAGLLIAAWGTGPVFAVNAASCVLLLLALGALRPAEMYRVERSGSDGTAREGFRYVRGRLDLIVIMACISVMSTFAMNNAINIAMMATTVFHRGAGEYGILSTILAVGGLCGAFVGTRRATPGLRIIGISAFGLGAALVVNAMMPQYAGYALTLFPDGLFMAIFLNACAVAVQLGTAPAMRGRVLALYVALQLGTTPIGSPLVGWIGQTFGARWSVLAGGVACIGAAAVCLTATWWLRPAPPLPDQERLTEPAAQRAS